jgi:hypothetical protein
LLEDAADERELVARLEDRDGAERTLGGGEEGRDRGELDSTRAGGFDREGLGRDSIRDGGGDEGRAGAGRVSTRSGLNGVELGLFERTPSITRRGME